MCYSVQEAEFLALKSDHRDLFNDFLLGYPCVQRSDMRAALRIIKTPGKVLHLMVDALDQLVKYAVLMVCLLLIVAVASNRKSLGPNPGRRKRETVDSQCLHRCGRQLSSARR
jgi:hypothetical protein